jgi:YD repeat-containing protein
MPTSTTVTWPATGQVAETDTTWDSIYDSGFYSGGDIPANDVSAGNIKSQKIYAYGSGTHGPLLQNKQYTYLHEQNSAYADANIVDRLAQVSIYDNSQPTPFSQTTTSYDQFNQASINGQGGLLQTTGTTNHDYTNFGSSATLRGLPTSVSRYGGTSTPSVITYADYNDLGMKTISTDGRGNSTSYTYGAQNAFLHSTSFPSTNGITHGITEDHDVNTGLLSSQTDQNNNSTIYTYDALMRPHTITRPDTGTTTYTYSDPNNISEVTTQSSSVSVTTNIVLDGLGRETSRTNVGSGVSTETHYDVNGRLYTVSNPKFAAATSSTDGLTTYLYDALGRKTSQTTTPDGAKLRWDYTGITIDHYDENNNHSQQTTDALGRLTAVIEPDPLSNLPSLETDYQYDPLNNLTRVDQWGGSKGTAGEQARIFGYDSLSRLIAASTPENSSAQHTPSLTCPGITGSWTACYGYDSNGNLQSKTDNRNITTTYSYDFLDRLTGKSYSGTDPSVSTTGSSCYQYDLPFDNGQEANFVGRLAGEWTQPNQCPTGRSLIPSSAMSWKSIMGYDTMGHVTSEQQCPLTPCTVASLIYTYDLEGNLYKSSNGMPSSVWPNFLTTYDFDSGNRLFRVSTTWNDTAHPGTLFEVAQAVNDIAPFGPVGWTAAHFGINPQQQQAALAQTRTYDNRIRLTGETAFANPLIATTVTITATATSFPSDHPPTTSVHVSCNSACGSVDFNLDGTDLGSFALDGSGNFVTGFAPSLSIGAHTLTVLYPGNSTYAASSNSATFTVIAAGPTSTTVDLTVSPTSFQLSSPPTTSVHVSCNSACGSVDFNIDGYDLGSFVLDGSGNFVTNVVPNLSVGPHTVTAQYSGNTVYAPSSNSVTVTVLP